MLIQHPPGETKKSHEKPQSSNLSSDLNTKQEPLLYETRFPTTQLSSRIFVTRKIINWFCTFFNINVKSSSEHKFIIATFFFTTNQRIVPWSVSFVWFSLYLHTLCHLCDLYGIGEWLQRRSSENVEANTFGPAEGTVDVGGWTISKWILERQDGIVWIGLIWLKIRTSGGLLWIRYWTFGFHEMLGSSWVAAQLMTPQEGLSSVSK
jgi:hypothetical protein